MPFCPNCKYEYKATVSICPDCDEPLVDVLPEDVEGEIEDAYDNWIPLCRLTSEQYAEMLVEALDSKDIPAIAHSGAGHFGITGQMGASSFRPIDGAFYTIMVPEEKADDAANEASIVMGDDWDKVRLR